MLMKQIKSPEVDLTIKTGLIQVGITLYILGSLQ